MKKTCIDFSKLCDGELNFSLPWPYAETGFKMTAVRFFLVFFQFWLVNGKSKHYLSCFSTVFYVFMTYGYVLLVLRLKISTCRSRTFADHKSKVQIWKFPALVVIKRIHGSRKHNIQLKNKTNNAYFCPLQVRIGRKQGKIARRSFKIQFALFMREAHTIPTPVVDLQTVAAVHAENSVLSCFL